MSLITKLSPSEQKELVFELQSAVNKAINKGYNEPSTVAFLTYLIPLHVNKLNLGYAGRVNISVGGVFVHQTPKVTFPGMVNQSSIELGDLLFVSTFINGANIVRKAMLYQAKMFKKLPVKPDNINQHKLYEKWPEFEYVRSGVLTGEKRNVKGLDLHSSAKYLLLRDGKAISRIPFYILHPKFRSGMVMTAHATSPLSTHECFIKESYHFAIGDAGKEYEILSPSDTDIGWNKVINDLLNVTAKKVTSVMRKASTGTNPTRGCFAFGEKMSFIDKDYEVSDAPPENFPPEIDSFDSEDGDGISVIEFVITSDQEE